VPVPVPVPVLDPGPGPGPGLGPWPYPPLLKMIIYYFKNLLGCSIRYASGVVAEYQYSQGLLNETMIDELNITQVSVFFLHT
jgi:hypothetical protein